MAATNVAGQIRDLRVALVKELNLLKDDVTAIRTLQAKVVTDLTALRTKYEAHTHDGVTAGAGVSGVRTAAMAADALTVAAPVAMTCNGLTHAQ